MPTFETLITFFITSFLLALAPGPDIIFVLAQSALFGFKAGFFTTLGLMTGVCAQTLAVALGVAVIFQTSPLAFNILKYCGAAYLCYLAWQAFRARPAPLNSSQKENFTGNKALYLRGLIMNVTNPKVVLFFLAFLPQFCDPARGCMVMQISVLGLVFILGAFPVFIVISFLGGALQKRFNSNPEIRLLLNKLAALVFISLALALFFTKI